MALVQARRPPSLRQRRWQFPPAGHAQARRDTIGLGEIIRFRVIAASESAFDQAVKLRVRDAVLAYLRSELQGAVS